MLSVFIWFPRLLLPRWYRRAVKAGVPRHDPMAMGAFKALPISEQRQLVNLTTRAEHQPPPIPTTPPTTQIPFTDATTATTSLPTLPGLSAGITAGLDKEQP
ncbi:hypothetical protein [Arachnia propionica]|uniref:Uncharacterized protein n=1 Tax=Arachnia propionica TaxID=1750 RepID=A0A3P1WRZ6_9ACTN|nr:hypothetical protein [Arachnia propionica]RRD48638.1 hypothetical protein EII35_12020 [Arachnia propionica]